MIELGDKLKKADECGLVALSAPARYDLPRMVARKNKVVSGVVRGIATLFKAWNIEVVEGCGEFSDAKTLTVIGPDGVQRKVEADAILIATGSSWPRIAQFPIDGTQIITSKEALDLETVPKRMVILGAGDEMTLAFDAGPPPPPGWRRDFLIHSVGSDKDCVLNTVYGQTVEPLPFRAMPAYPYPGDAYPERPELADYLRRYQTREQPLAAPPSPRARFDRPSAPMKAVGR